MNETWLPFESVTAEGTAPTQSIVELVESPDRLYEVELWIPLLHEYPRVFIRPKGDVTVSGVPFVLGVVEVVR